jgi:hypothetical protein
MTGNSPTFAVPLTVQDKYSETFKRFSKAADVTFREVGKSAHELSRAFEPLGQLSGLGGLAAGGLGFAAVAEGINSFSAAGVNLGRTSARIGETTQAVSAFNIAAYVAGGASDTGAKALEALGQKLHGAAWGRDQEAVAVFQEFGIAVRDANTHMVRAASDVLPEIAGKIKGLVDPYQQASLAQALFGQAGIDMLPILRRGAAGVEEARATAAKYGVEASKSFQDAAGAFEQSQRTFEASSKDFGAALARDVMPGMAKFLTSSTGMMDQLAQMPAAMKAIEVGGGALATLFGVTLVSALTTFAFKLNAVWGMPLLRFLAGSGVGAAGAAAAVFFGGKATGGNEITPEANQPAFDKKLGANDYGSDVNRLTPTQARAALEQGTFDPNDAAATALRDRLTQRATGATVAPTPPAPDAAGAAADKAGANAPADRAAGPTGGAVIPPGYTPAPWAGAPGDTQQQISHPERNNPGNLRADPANNWLGSTTKPGDAFESFDTMEHGIRARARTYASYLREGADTPAKIAARSGPASDGNDIPSQIAAYRQALGGKYLEKGGEDAPVQMTPENIRRLTAAGIGIEAGGQGKFLPQGAGMGAIDQALANMGKEGVGGPAAAQPAVAGAGGVGGDNFLQDPRNLRLGGAMGRPDLHQDVIDWLNKAGPAALGPGWRAELAAGPANHTYGTYTTGAQSQVTLGQAADVTLIDPKGNRIPHPVDIGAEDPNFSPYKKLADAYIMASKGVGRAGVNYGRPDRMQYGTIGPDYPAGANASPGLYAAAHQTQVATAVAAIPRALRALNPVGTAQAAEPAPAEPAEPPVIAGSGPEFVPGVGSPAPAGTSTLNSLHHVQINIPTAPPGTRADITRADGPATVGLRVGHAMQGG